MKKYLVLIIALAFLAAPAVLFAQQAQQDQAEQPEAEPQEQEQAQVEIEQAEPQVEIEQAEPEVRIIRPDEQEQAEQEQEQAPAQQQEQPQQEAQPQEQEPQQLDQSQALRRLDELIDTPIASQAGDLEGAIRDVVLTLEGDLTHVVVDLDATRTGETQAQPQEAPPAGQDRDGFLQAEGAGRYLVPVDRVTFGQPNQTAALDMSAQEFEQQPRLQEDDRLPAEIAEQDGLAQARHVLGSELSDYTFVGQDGEEIGGVEGFMLDLEQNRVVYIALATGGFLGLGEKLVAVPMESITGWNADEEQIQTNLTNEQIDNVEGFDADNWPQQPRDLAAAAQAQPRDPQQPAEQPPQIVQQDEEPREQPEDSEQLRREQYPMMRRHSELEGTEVTSDIVAISGEVQDVVLSVDGRITHLVIEASQLAGVGDQSERDTGAVRQIGASGRYLVPIDRASFAQDWDQPVSLDLGDEGILNLTEVEDDRMPAGVDPGVAEDELILASTLQDYELVDNGGENLGGIEGMMLNLEENQVAYLALSPEGELGQGGRLVAVTMDQITGWNHENENVQTSLSRAELEQARGFEDDSWPIEAGPR